MPGNETSAIGSADDQDINTGRADTVVEGDGPHISSEKQCAVIEARPAEHLAVLLETLSPKRVNRQRYAAAATARQLSDWTSARRRASLAPAAWVGPCLLLLICAHRTILEHKLLALRAVVTGALVMMAVWSLFARRLADLDYWLFAIGWADIRSIWFGGQHPFAHFLIGGTLNATVGYVIARTHPRHTEAMVVAFFVSLTICVDLPRVIPAAIEALRDLPTFARFLEVASLDFLLLRVTILIGGFYGCTGFTNRHRLFRQRASDATATSHTE